MTSKEINVVRAFIAAINRRNPADISALMTDDHTFVDSGGGTQSGRETMTAGWKEYFRLFPDYEIHVEKMLSDKALVAVFGSASGTYNGKRGLVPENRIAMPAAWKALVENGKIKRWQVYTDWTEGSKTIEKDREWLGQTLDTPATRMSKTRQEHEVPIPINCFWVGGSFLDYCVKQAWLIKRREGRSTRYYCTRAGVDALKQFGIEILRPEERKRKSRTKR